MSSVIYCDVSVIIELTDNNKVLYKQAHRRHSMEGNNSTDNNLENNCQDKVQVLPSQFLETLSPHRLILKE